MVRAHVLRLAGASVGRGANVRQGARFRSVRNLEIGEFVSIGYGSYFDCEATVTIGDRSVLSPRVTILTASHNLDGEGRTCGSMLVQPVTIEEGAWLCYGCTILPGVTVGRMSVVAAGSVVTADVPNNVMVGGVPARLIKQLDDRQELSDVVQEEHVV